MSGSSIVANKKRTPGSQYSPRSIKRPPLGPMNQPSPRFENMDDMIVHLCGLFATAMDAYRTGSHPQPGSSIVGNRKRKASSQSSPRPIKRPRLGPVNPPSPKFEYMDDIIVHLSRSYLGIKSRIQLSRTCRNMRRLLSHYNKLDRELYNAVCEGSVDGARACILRGAAPDECGLLATAMDSYMWIAWDWSEDAPVGSRSQLVEALLSGGLDANEIARDGLYALETAVMAADNKLVEILLCAGADPNRVEHGDTPLVTAVRVGDPAVVKALLRHGAEPDIAVSGATALHLSIDMRNIDITNMLLRAGADPERPAPQSTPLAKAILLNDIHLVQMLLDHGADAMGTLQDGTLLLAHALDSDKIAVVEALILAAGANATFGVWGSALHLACERAATTTVGMLLQTPNLDINATNRVGETALHIAISVGDLKIIRMLLGHDNIDLNRKTIRHRFTPLHVATQVGRVDIVLLLRKAGYRLSYLRYLERLLSYASDVRRVRIRLDMIWVGEGRRVSWDYYWDQLANRRAHLKTSLFYEWKELKGDTVIVDTPDIWGYTAEADATKSKDDHVIDALRQGLLGDV